MGEISKCKDWERYHWQWWNPKCRCSNSSFTLGVRGQEHISFPKIETQQQLKRGLQVKNGIHIFFSQVLKDTETPKLSVTSPMFFGSPLTQFSKSIATWATSVGRFAHCSATPGQSIGLLGNWYWTDNCLQQLTARMFHMPPNHLQVLEHHFLTCS